MASRAHADTLRRGKTSPVTSELSLCSLVVQWWKPLAGNLFISSRFEGLGPINVLRREHPQTDRN